MTVRDFLKKHKNADAPAKRLFQDAVEEVSGRVVDRDRRPPCHLPDQRTLIHRLFDHDGNGEPEPVWMFFFDAGRFDMFDQLVGDYFEGDLRRCWNGGVGYTGDWADRNLRFDFGDRGLFTQMPLRHLQGVDYDGRDNFAIAPDISHEQTVGQRLAALGYTSGDLDECWDISPYHVNAAVRDSDVAGGVVRYLKPHPPFVGMQELTSESTKTAETQAALDAGDITYQELTDAYRSTYRIAFEAAADLVPQLDGRVILTADHGTCLTCGQLFHGRHLEKHDHLTHVPWFEVDRTL